MALTHMTVAVSDSFFTAYSRLPKNQQAKVMNFVNKFRLDPTSGGINYETLKNVKDRPLRSVRIDDDYRGIVCKPSKGNVYLLLWVDKHDAAYQWARNRVCEINPLLGTVQVFCVDETVELHKDEPAEVKKSTPVGLFDDIRDRELLALGVPEIQLEMIRGIDVDCHFRIPTKCHNLLPKSGLFSENLRMDLIHFLVGFVRCRSALKNRW